MSFTPELLKQHINSFTNTACIWVAYSGGCDSHVLLHSLAALRSEITAEIKAIHINHGLSPLANEWEEHCRVICEQLSVPYLAISVDASKKKTSPEEAARHARYAEWKKLINKDEVILLAHHQDDQAETVLLQLLRGSGVKGLAAMPAQQNFSQGLLCRPMLGFLREEIVSYAVEQNLNWIDDPSNFDTDFDRNFLRHDVVPLLETRWPSLKKTLSRTASHQADADQLLTELAFQDWHHVHEKNHINILALLKLSQKRQRNVLRYWIADVCELMLPDTVHLQRILDEVLTAAEDANPEVIWRGGEVRRYQGLLYAQEKLLEPENNFEMIWSNIETPLLINSVGLKLSASSSTGEGLSQNKLKSADILIKFRQGGESCRPVGRGQTHQLKKLFQEWQVPPWQRALVPLVYVNGELAEVVGYCRCEPFAAIGDDLSWLIEEIKT
ncbi:MAG: tRNA lysidine(34) synthetase TilS [Gammaproteobacteria bacterium]|nr:tRNA lysidine(34) synthetase TilS [Gammaproteobacteria bacterium]